MPVISADIVAYVVLTPPGARGSWPRPSASCASMSAVVFTLGRFTGVKGPGLIILIPSFSSSCAWTSAPSSSMCRGLREG
jgi:hypothetical protein